MDTFCPSKTKNNPFPFIATLLWSLKIHTTLKTLLTKCTEDVLTDIPSVSRYDPHPLFLSCDYIILIAARVHTRAPQWARNAPSASWRLGGPTTPPNPPPPPPHHLARIPYSRYDRRRSMSPPRGRSPSQLYHHHSRSRSPIPTSTSGTFHTIKHSPSSIKKRSLSPSRHYHSPPLL